MLLKTILVTNCVWIFLVSGTVILPNKTHHSRRSNTEENNYFKNSKKSYRSFQPVHQFNQYHKSYPRPEAPDYDGITSYDNEYGGMVSNFTSSIYDDNPPLYPNPEIISTNKAINIIDDRSEVEVDIPDDSLADADLKEHNIIDSVTYLYGFTNCHGVRNEWMILVFFTSVLSVCLLLGAMSWMIWSERASEFRRHSKLYPININLCCCLAACMLIYIQAAMGVSSPSQCERIALLLHYTHIACALWIAMLACAVAEYSTRRTVPPLKYNYLLAYGVPCVVVMFNYALSMEHYETKHYCWMSIEKGMVLGFMVPAMLLIVLNTCVVIVGLQGVNKMQAEMLSVTIQELVDHHIANWPKSDSIDDKNDSLENIYTPSSSRKNTDTSENLSEDECPCNLGQGGENCDSKSGQDKGTLSMLYMDNLSWKWSWNTEGNELKTYLHLCLVLQPFFAINWVMGVVAIENAAHWSTPTVYLILVMVMTMYLCGTICSTLPVIGAEPACCEDVVIVEPEIHRARTTDSIPLLDPSVQQPTTTPAPVDTISTISI